METDQAISISDDWALPILDWVQDLIQCDSASILDYTALRGESLDGCLVKIETSYGVFYFKGVGERHSHEPRITVELARRYPAHLPEIVGFDSERRWILMKDVGGTSLNDVSDISIWEGAMRSFAQIQIYYTDRQDSLLRLGCCDWRMNELSDKIDPFFAQVSSFNARDSKEIIAFQREDTLSLTSKLKELCLALAAYEIPSSLVHGDFHLDNILVNDRNCVFIDWAAGYLGHPFFAIADFFGYIGYARPDLATYHDSLRAAYLNEWVKYTSITNLNAAFKISRPLAMLRYAINVLEVNLKPRPDLDERLPDVYKYVGGLIKRVKRDVCD